MKKYALILIWFPLLFSCKNADDIKYNDVSARLFKLKLGYDLSLKMFDNIIERQIDFRQGLKVIDKNDKNLSIEELRLLNQGEYFLHFTPTAKDIEDANEVIRKINEIKPLMQKVSYLCDQTHILYKMGKNIDRSDKIIKHPNSDYAIMEKNYQQVKLINKEISSVLGMSLVDFIKLYDVHKTLDNITSEWLQCVES
jgi:hypothetical protein